MRFTIRVLLPLVALAVMACGGRDAATETLRFTAIPGDNTTDLTEKFGPLEAYLSEKLGVPVEYVATEDYAASVEAFINGDVHLAWFGGLTGVRARAAVDGARAIAQGKVDPEYRSYFIANADAGIEPGEGFPMGIKGKRFTFGSQGSTSGRLMPEYFIRTFAKMSPQEMFGAEMSFSGSHEKTAKQVEAGTFDAGVMDYKTYDRLVAEKKLDPNRCFVIWETPPFPDYNWTAHPALEELFGPGTIRRLQDVLIGLDRPDLLAAINRPEGLMKAKNEDWDALAGLARDLGLLR